MKTKSEKSKRTNPVGRATKNVSFNSPMELKLALEAYAESQGKSLGEVLRQFAAEGLIANGIRVDEAVEKAAVTAAKEKARKILGR